MIFFSYLCKRNNNRTMVKNVLMSVLLSLIPLMGAGQEYTDPETNVVYTYNPSDNSAMVKAGREFVRGWEVGEEGEIVYEAGSPNVSDNIVLLDRFVVDDKEYTVSSIGERAFIILYRITGVTFPNTLTAIGESAFYCCGGLTKIEIPEPVATIGKHAFFRCTRLTSVELPRSITSIGKYAFLDCRGLKNIVSHIEEPFDTEAFGNMDVTGINLYVPDGCASKYRAAKGWNAFTNIVEMDDDTGKPTAEEVMEYFPEGTKWTEIRLDTLKYNSWYTQVGNECVPNFETIEYCVKGEYVHKNWKDNNIFKKVYTNGPEWKDSLTLMLQENENSVTVAVQQEYDGEVHLMAGGIAYQFDWYVGKGLYYVDITSANTTSFFRAHHYYGFINEIKEGVFGGIRPLKYVDVDGKAPDDEGYIKNFDTKGGRIIQGIGITEWNSGECLFGQVGVGEAFEGQRESHYRSMLVHFERNGEVLYDVWPEQEPISGISPATKNVETKSLAYDLQGRPIQGYSHKGLQISNGKKAITKP